MLLNEVQRQQREIETQAAQAREQARLIDEVTARLSRCGGEGRRRGTLNRNHDASRSRSPGRSLDA